VDTLIWRPFSEIKNETAARNFWGANGERFAWQTSEAQGSICQAISCVLIDPAQKLA
jgi:hypothetical protein